MGLDMFLFRIQKINENEKKQLIGKTVEGLEEEGYSVFHTDEVPKSLYREIKPWLTPFTAGVKALNYDKIKKEHKIPEEAYCIGTGYGDGKYRIHFEKSTLETDKAEDAEAEEPLENLEHYKVEIPIEVMDEKYTMLKTETVNVAKMKEVGYWRKNYELAESITDSAFEEGVAVENCGYYPMTDSMWNDVKRLDRKTYDEAYEENTDEYIIAYHEWY